MNSSSDNAIAIEHLHLKAIRKNKKTTRLLKKIEKGIRKKQPNMIKVLSLLVKQGIMYLDQREALIRPKVEPERPVETEVFFNVRKISERFVIKFGTTSCVYRATMDHPKEEVSSEVKDILTELSSLFTNVIDMVKDKCELKTQLEDKIPVMIRSAALKTPISTRLLPAIQMTSNKVLAEVTKVLQSNEHIPLDQSFTVDVVAIKQPTGSGKVNKKSLRVLDYAKDSLVKKSIITIRNNDNLCCGRSLAVGQALADNHPKLKQNRSAYPKKVSTRFI